MNLFSGDLRGPKWTLDVEVLHVSLSELDKSDVGELGMHPRRLSLRLTSMLE